MDKQRCRFLLRAFRPNGADSADPTFREALEQARLDPELNAWFSREQAIDGALAARLRDFRAPAELRQQILDGLAVSARRPARRPLLTVLTGIAAAASVALAIYTAWPKNNTRGTFESIVASVLTESRREPELKLRSASAEEIRAWFASTSAPVPGELPRRLAALETVGASALVWDGVSASLVTFRAPASFSETHGVSASTTIHLFTVRQNSCSAAAVPRQPAVITRDGQSVATWRDGSNYYIVSVRAPEAALRELLDTTSVAQLAHFLEKFSADSPRNEPAG